MKFVSVVFESVGYNQAAYMFSVDFFPLILGKYSVPLFHRAEHITYSPLMLLSCGLLLPSTRLHQMTVCWPVLKKERKKSFLDLTSLIVTALPVSFIMKNILRGLNIPVFGHFQRILLVMKILKGYLFCVVGIMNPLFLTARSVGLTTSSVAQVGCSLDKVTLEILLYQRNAHRVSTCGGRLK
jgi:hypothetical protein